MQCTLPNEVRNNFRNLVVEYFYLEQFNIYVVGQGGKIPLFIMFMGLHASTLPKVRNLKIGQGSGTPQGRRHAITLAFLLIPMHSEGSHM